MNKQKILKTLISELQKNLETLINSAIEAKDAATNEESKAENKYDTRGLEASYLAGAQAKRAEELKHHINKLFAYKLKDFPPTDPVGLTSVVKVQVNSNVEKYFFILPFAGGSKVIVENNEYLTVTPGSPIAEQLIGKKKNDCFELSGKSGVVEYEILDCK